MKNLLLAAALLTPLCLPAQMTLSAVEQGVEQAIGESCFVGTVPAGDRIDATFRLRNSSPAPALLYGLNVGGYRFSFASLPKLPIELGTGKAVEFVVRFQPDKPGSYGAYLNINGVRATVLLGTATASLVVALEGGDALDTAQGVDFGRVEPDGRSVRRFTLTNPAEQPLTAGSLTVNGDSFHGPLGIVAPVTLTPGQSVAFEVAFEPQSAGPAQGALQLDQRTYPLRGTAPEPTYPKVLILPAAQSSSGGEQVKLSIRLESQSLYSGRGEITIEFTPSIPGNAQDPAVIFPSTGKNSAVFTVAKGEDLAHFGSRAEIEFQTGSTAGTLVFTARLGSQSSQATFVIAPSPVFIDSVRPLRAAESLEVRVNGFDNSRSASILSFTFFDNEGRVVAPGAIRADATAAFRQYFEKSEFGGVFTVRAVFPVSGNALQITAVEVEATNSIGLTRFLRTEIQ